MAWTTGGRIELVEHWPEPPATDDDVVVRVKAAGVCSTDIHMIAGRLSFAKPPWVPGHEISGEIASVGSRVAGWKVGQRVAVDPIVGCGCCTACRSGKSYLCQGGGEIGTNYGSGGYGQFVVARPSNLYALPDELDDTAGALLEPLTCTLGATQRAGDLVGKRALVFGPGPAGLLFTQLALAGGAIAVTLVGLDPERLALGKRLGAARTIDNTSGGLASELGEERFDVVFEASGSVAAVEDCMRYVTRGGTVVLYGLHGSGRAAIDSDTVVGKDLRLVTCIAAPQLWERSIDLVRAGKINLAALISDIVPFREAARKLNDCVAGHRRPFKMIIVHE
ncbi:zinc-dependent alcohol dehydrogenase [Paenibacillus cymbidii]|uniref:zinc-dependent alcohol dehydrogenase n=1 Tax=Paenibacillus cymbidii TaxID=1639034 RepID=UPI0014368211|nr:alcohol dehydrogenase catalytic domain-containing protein [Paenibacillus cymbidii]